MEYPDTTQAGWRINRTPVRIEPIRLRPKPQAAPRASWARLTALRAAYLRGDIGGPNDGSV